MRAVLLAAGLGTRLRPITNTVPKCLVPIHGKPLIGYWFDLLLGSRAVDRVLVNLHYFPDAVRAYIAGSEWKGQVDLVHEIELLGTGGTLLANAAWFGSGAFMVVHADNLSDFDVRPFVDAHAQRPAHCAITMMTFPTDHPQSCGIVELDERNVVVRFHEKVANPPGNLANGAVYIFEPDVLAFMKALGKPVIDLSTEVLPAFLGRISTFHNERYHRDIGTPASLRAAEVEFRPRVQA
jgi:mannose-1-phosphate guanylyltransferase